MDPSSLPPPHEQRRLFREAASQDVDCDGQKFYVIASQWFRSWSDHVELNVDEQSDSPTPSPIDTSIPSQIDNRPICVENSDGLERPFFRNATIVENFVEMKQGLQEPRDYSILSESCWRLLHSWYGGGPEIERLMISDGDGNQSKLLVEVYPLFLRVKRTKAIFDKNKANPSDDQSENEILISKKAKVEHLSIIGSFFYHVLINRIRLWFFPTKGTLKSLDNKNETLEEALICHGQSILIEIEENGKWPLDVLLEKVENNDGKDSGLNENGGSTKKNNRSFNFFGLFSGIKQERYKRGICGLENLGNTCFMNSALQCLSNTQPLTEDYLLTNKYKAHINTTNPLGTGGYLAKEYANILKEIWSGANSSVAPSKLKLIISRYAPQFSGYNQHDSQELLAFLLDGLHEDLNQITDKIVVEQITAREDESAAVKSWEQHLLRNKSIIVDLFQGQLKSTLLCNECSNISIKFDPYMYLSIPIPSSSTRKISIIAMCTNIDFDKELDAVKTVENVNTLPIKYCFEVTPTTTIGILRHKFAEKIGEMAQHILLVDIYKNRFDSILSDNTNLSNVISKDILLAFIAPPNRQSQTKLLISQRILEPQVSLVGLPFMVYPPNKIKSKDLYEMIWNLVQRFSKKKERYPFTLSIVNSKMSSCAAPKCSKNQNGEFCLGCNLPCDETIITLTENSSIPLALDWNEPDYFDSMQSLTVQVDESVSKMKQKQNTAIKLQDCLHLFAETEQLGSNDPWYCPQCKEHRSAYKKFEIWSLPEILIIHLKRFMYNRYFRQKINTYVDYPLDNLDMSPFMVKPPNHPIMYELYAISNHSGDIGGGHYTAYAKNFVDKKWYCFNDSFVSPVEDLGNLKVSSAYVLFYRKKKAHIIENATQSKEIKLLA